MKTIFVQFLILAFAISVFQSCSSDQQKVNKEPVIAEKKIAKSTEPSPKKVETVKSQLVKTTIKGKEYYELDLSGEAGESEINKKIAEQESATKKEVILAVKDKKETFTEKGSNASSTPKKVSKPKKAKKKPEVMAKINFANKTHKYGMIMQGDEVNHKFEFTNTGKEDLVITNVEASCGCTQPSYPFIPIPPGEKGYIGVVFSSKGKMGPQKPTVTVMSNASNPKVKLYLDGFVDAERSKSQAPPGEGIMDEEEYKKIKEEEKKGN